MWTFPLYHQKIGTRLVGKSYCECSECGAGFDNLVWNCRYCPYCGFDNGYKNKVEYMPVNNSRVVILQRQVQFLYHNAPDYLRNWFNESFPDNRKVNDIGGETYGFPIQGRY